jgi:histidyl-tRNA synthetase
MSNTIQAIRGMNDILPNDTAKWQKVEETLKTIIESYGYQEIRFPALEKTQLFKRTIGDVTDIVEKEMYSFDDKNGDNLSLRPEGTACCVRAGIEHGLLYNQTPKLWYMGPFYRHERPQKGRYRQFHQLGLEAFGTSTPDVDAELIALSARIFNELNLTDKVSLEINSIGSSESRIRYREVLVDYLNQHKDQLDEDSLRRLSTNPMRILDSKNPALKDIIAAAPKMLDHLDEQSQQHFDELLAHLDRLGISYQVNPAIVRGLDYYNDTVFEWTTNELGAQGTICAGGRYNGLVEQLGGKATPAIGFALGIERLLLLIEPETTPAIDAYLIVNGEKAQQQALNIAEQIRSAIPQLRLLNPCSTASLKNQFKKADKSGAQYAFIVGNEEIAAETITIKYLRKDIGQSTISIENLPATLKSH